MTLSQDRHEQSPSPYLLENARTVNPQGEANLIACKRAAEEGILVAQLALAQFYSANRTSPKDALHAYAWYSIVSERISQTWKDITETMTVDEVVEAEQMAAKWLDGTSEPRLIQTDGSAQAQKPSRVIKPIARAAG